MGKTIAINPSWYWPDDIPRLIGVPPFPCERMVLDRWVRRRPDSVAAAGADESLTFAETRSRVRRRAAGLLARAPSPSESPRVAIVDPAGVDGVITVLAALTSRIPALLLDSSSVGDPREAAESFGATVAIVSGRGSAPGGLEALAADELDEAGSAADAAAAAPSFPLPCDVHADALGLVTAVGGVASHSHYSLLSGALSVAAFLGLDDGRAWLSAMPLARWEGLYAALVPLYTGAAAVVADDRGATDDLAGAVDDNEVGWTILPYESAGELAKGRPKRLCQAFKRNLQGVILSTSEAFSTRDRRKVRKALGVDVLTVYGMAEMGPILASHPSWYVEESVGIPLTNVEVQPANPATGEPLDTLWELLDHASMVVRAPLLMNGYEGEQARRQDEEQDRLEEGWFRTGTLASFDGNGMMYLV